MTSCELHAKVAGQKSTVFNALKNEIGIKSVFTILGRENENTNRHELPFSKRLTFIISRGCFDMRPTDAERPRQLHLIIERIAVAIVRYAEMLKKPA